ncbi:hypothetical protein H4219_000441 [Mycoemilia scoparia]|uniref:Uncharacterized protein n=1 Tax=Mycoemilia scoparia TaxID=417184 RepID=A0A9W8A5U2_9FUNG|nr:hypothetical protein H4219_000441 [Mycoemilia scoparia]
MPIAVTSARTALPCQVEMPTSSVTASATTNSNSDGTNAARQIINGLNGGSIGGSGHSANSAYNGNNSSNSSSRVGRNGESIHDVIFSSKLKTLHMLHQKASRALVLGQSISAWEICTEAIRLCQEPSFISKLVNNDSKQVCVRTWTLYICTLSTLAEVSKGPPGKENNSVLCVKPDHSGFQKTKLEGFPNSTKDVWSRVVETFGSVPGQVSSEVLVPFVLMCIKLRDISVAREAVEVWLATQPDESIYLLEKSVQGRPPPLPLRTHVFAGNNASVMQASYLRVCELYLLHILPQCDDLPSAKDFLEYNELIPNNVREFFSKRLDALQAVPPKPQKKSSKKKSKSHKRSKRHSGSKKSKAEAEELLAKDEKAAIKNNDKEMLVSKGDEDGDNDNTRNVATEKSTPKPAVLPTETMASVSTIPSSLTRQHKKSQARAHQRSKPHKRNRNILSTILRFVRRVISEWGITLLTTTIIFGVLRLLFRRLPMTALLKSLLRKIWQTIQMGTKITYL